MVSSRRELDELAEERLIRAGAKKPVVKQEKQKRYYVQVDCELFFCMTEKVSRTACRVASLMLKDMNHFTNIFSGTCEEIQGVLNLTDRPVREAMAELRKVDFMRWYKNGRYMINPTVAIACGEEHAARIIDTYHSLQTDPAKKRNGGKKNADR